jgi:hypothetical protein
MCLNEKTIGDDRSKSAQGSDETKLPEFLSKIEIEFDAAEVFLSMLGENDPFRGQFNCAEGEEG